MMSPPGRVVSRLAALAVAGILAGCATGLPEVEPGDIPRLEQDVAANPDDTEALTLLGIAHYKAGNYEESRVALAMVTGEGAGTGPAYLYLGLTHEAMEDWSSARQAYASYLETGRSGPLLDRIQDRLSLMIRKEIRAEAETTLAQEDQLTDADPTPGTVAVFPFPLLAESPELEPLRVALADMMITDLSLSGGLTVLERTRIQTLLDEMALSEAGLAEEATGARAGRMLRAEFVVQGALTPLGQEALRFDAGVLATGAGDRRGEVSRQDQVQAIFDMEKAIVFQVLDVLGVEITPAEREAINENRAQNLLAFLAYGRGLMAQDEGDFQQAAEFFGQASQLDPSFTAARQQQQQAAALQSAEATTTDEIVAASADEMAATGGVEGLDDGLRTGTDDLLGDMVENTVPNPGGELVDLGQTVESQANDRDPNQEAANQEGVTQATTARIRIRITRPGSGGGQ